MNDELFLGDGDEENATSVTKSNWEAVFKEYREEHQGEAPTMVEPVERLLADVRAISQMFDSSITKHRLVRGEIVKDQVGIWMCIRSGFWLDLGNHKRYHSLSVRCLGGGNAG